MSIINAISRTLVTHLPAGADERPVAQTRPQGPIELGMNRSVRLRDALGAAIDAVRGALWITQSGDIRDIVLEAGDVFVVDREGEVVVSALSNAAFRVAPALAQSAKAGLTVRRRAAWLSGSGEAVAA